MNMIYRYIDEGYTVYHKLIELEELRLANDNIRLRIELQKLENLHTPPDTTVDKSALNASTIVQCNVGPAYTVPAPIVAPVQQSAPRWSRRQMVIEWVDTNPPMNGESTLSYYDRCDSCMPIDSVGVSIRVFDSIAKSMLLTGNKTQYYRYECVTGIYPTPSNDIKDGRWYCN